MNSFQWIKLLDEQNKKFNKAVFTVTELMSLSGMTRHYLSVQLGRLVKRGVLTRYRHGLYGRSECPPEQIVHYIDPSAYCTGHYALYKHGFVTQIPTTVTCFTKRHHCRNRMISAGSVKYEFVKSAPGIYSYPISRIASPEQAFCDYVYFCRNRGMSFSSLSTFRKLSNLDKNKVETILAHYPKTVHNEAMHFLK